MNLSRFTSDQWELDTFHVFDDFWAPDTAFWWTKGVPDSGTVTTGDGNGGLLTLTPSDGSVAANDEAFVYTPHGSWELAAGRELYAKARLKWTETAAGAYAVAFGLVSGVGEDVIADGTQALRASGTIIALYKISGENLWRCVARNGSTVTTGTSTTVAAGGTYYVVELVIKDWDGVNMEVAFKVDGAYLKDTNGLVIRMTVPISGASAMALYAGAKLSAGANNDTTIVDYVYGASSRT